MHFLNTDTMKTFYSNCKGRMAQFVSILAGIMTAITPALTADAEHLSAEQALARAGVSPTTARLCRAKKPARLVADLNQIYVFTAGEGFMVLPADDVAPAVLGYCDSGTYERGVNKSLDYWLDFYAQQIDYAVKHHANSGRQAASSGVKRTAIAPLTKTEWNQEAPYNDMCPKVNGHETVTGCVATAMAQIIRTHEHPYRPYGSHSYEWKAQYRDFKVDSVLSINYDTVSFDFSNMPYVYDKTSTDVQKRAVAELMMACGYSVDMGYNIGDSGAATMKMGTALIDHFKYDKSIWMPERNYYGLEEWEDMIYADLAKGLPVLYAGYGTGGGHQFICDGYSNGYFHFNWGWGGMCNGYFLLDALNPESLGVGGGSGGFNYNQQITLNVMPEQEDSKYTYLVYCGGFTTSDTIPAVGDEMTFGGTYFNYGLHALPAGTYYGLEIVSAAGDTTYVQGSEAMKLGPLYGQESFRAKWPQLAPGTYTVMPALKDEYGRWSEIHSPLNGHSSYTAVVSEQGTILTQGALPVAEASDIKLDSKLYTDTKCSVSFTVTNEGENEHIWNVAPALLDTDGNIVAIAGTLEVDLQGGASRVIDNFVTQFDAIASDSKTASATASSATTLAVGTYTLTVINADNKVELADSAARVEVELQEKPTETRIEVSDFVVNDGKEVPEGESADFKFLLKCTEGFVDENIYIFIFKDGGDGYDVMSHTFEAPLISEGEEREESALVNLSSLGEGDYTAYVYYGSSYDGAPARFKIAPSITVAVEDISAAAAPQAVYDLMGRRLTHIPSDTPVIADGQLRIYR